MGLLMIKVECFSGKVRIPFLLEDFYVTFDGELSDKDGGPLTLSEFNNKTNLDVNSIEVLQAVAFQRFAWAPLYWSSLRALRTVDTVSSPENLVLGIETPTPSKEFPGFFLIPYFSDYVVSPCGRMIKRSSGRDVMASKGPLGYYTYRMTDDSNSTANRLRHRILCYAFKPYPANVMELDVNHIDGCPGSDNLDNLEWLTRSGNMEHAYQLGLRSDNIEVEIRDVNSKKVYIFASYSQAGRFIGVTETTISNRVKTNGYKSFNGYQFRKHPSTEPWPNIEPEEGKYLVTFPDGVTKQCGSIETAQLAGLTRTSLMRSLREGRCYGKTQVKFTRL